MPSTPKPPEGDIQTVHRLERRLSRLYCLRDLALALPGAAQPYTIALPADPDAPLDRLVARLRGALPSGDLPPPTLAPFAEENAAMQARQAVASGARLPYWSLLWPSGLALAEAMLTSPTLPRGQRALELGCGLGITTVAALACDTRLWAADCFAEALLFTRYNALRNTGQAPRTLLLDWRTPAGHAACLECSPFDFLLAADVLYEEEDCAPLLELVPRLLAPGGIFWLAEPGRRVSRAFVAAACERGWQDDETVYEHAWPPTHDTVRVAVHRFTPSSSSQAPRASRASRASQ